MWNFKGTAFNLSSFAWILGKAVLGDLEQRPLKAAEIPTEYNSLRIRQIQAVFRPHNHKMMPANWRSCLIPNWQPNATRLGLCNSLRCSAVHSGKAYEGTCRIPRQNGDGRGRRLGKKNDSPSVYRGLYMKCLIWEDTWGHWEHPV